MVTYTDRIYGNGGFQQAMGKKIIAAAVLLLVLSVLWAAAGAEEISEDQAVATPTDLVCPHAHTRTTYYFYDSPNYTALSAVSHRVNGPATAETVCEDCGALLDSEVLDNAEEIRPHTMKKGVCALCGYRQKAEETETRGTPRKSGPGERAITAQRDESGLYTLTLSQQDLAAFANARINTVLVLGKTGRVVVAINVAVIRKEAEKAGASVLLEMTEQEDGSFFAALFLVKGTQRSKPENAGISLRFYQDKKQEIRFSVAPSDTEQMAEADAAWNEEGYWAVPYVEEGTYFPLQK